MVLGLSKDFVFAMIIAGIFWAGLDDWTVAAWIIGTFIIIKIIWRFLTK